MENNNLNYISKQDCVKRGLTKLKNGRIYKPNILETYAIKGFLDGTDYDIIELLLAGKRIYRDFYEGKIENITANDPSRIIVDGRDSYNESDIVTSASKRFNKAIQSLPKKTLSIVTRVCCEDKDIIVTGNEEERIRSAEHSLELLKLGLCELVNHYRIEDQYYEQKQI